MGSLPGAVGPWGHCRFWPRRGSRNEARFPALVSQPSGLGAVGSRLSAFAAPRLRRDSLRVARLAEAHASTAARVSEGWRRERDSGLTRLSRSGQFPKMLTKVATLVPPDPHVTRPGPSNRPHLTVAPADRQRLLLVGVRPLVKKLIQRAITASMNCSGLTCQSADRVRWVVSRCAECQRP